MDYDPSFCVRWEDQAELCFPSLLGLHWECAPFAHSGNPPIKSPSLAFLPFPGWFYYSFSWISWNHSKIIYLNPSSCLRSAFCRAQYSLCNATSTHWLQTVLWTKLFAFLPWPEWFPLSRTLYLPFCGLKLHLSSKTSQFILLLRCKTYSPLHDNLYVFAIIYSARWWAHWG